GARRRHLRPRKKCQVAAGMPFGVSVKKVVGARIVLVHAALDQTHAEHAGVKVQVLLCRSRDRRNVVQPVDAVHPPIVAFCSSGNVSYSAEMAQNWPALPYDAWRETNATLHMWTQIVGKVALALTPRANHFWNITLEITARGLATHTLNHDHRAFTMTFDFV